MFCPNCGNTLTGNEEFCPRCGYNMLVLKKEMSTTSEVSPVKQEKTKKKPYLLIVLGIIILILIILALCFFLFQKKEDKDYGTNASLNYVMTSLQDNGLPKFIDGAFSKTKVTNEEEALTVLSEIKELQIKDAQQEFELVSKETNEGITYYRFNQMWEGIEVYDQNVILAVDDNGAVSSFSGYYIPNINVDISAGKTEAEMRTIAEEYLGANAQIASIEKVIYANEQDTGILAYQIIGSGEDNTKEMLWNATTGEMIAAIDLFDTATPYEYTGTGLNNITHTITIEEYFDVGFFETEYRFIDPTRNIVVSNCSGLGNFISQIASIINNNALYKDPISFRMNENGALTYYDLEFVQNAVSTMAHYEKIYDYYKEVLGRDSYDDKGSTIYVCIGVEDETFSGKDLNNAFWSSLVNRMFIGDYNGKSFSASLDVLGHEFTHGVISKTASFAKIPKDKNKANESAALNEAYADIMGSLIEGQNWTIAESNEIVRNLENPESLENPSIKGGEYYFPDSFINGKTIEEYLEEKGYDTLFDYDNGGEHRNSTVVSHAAYLMYENEAFESREEMAKVWYNSLFLLSSYSNFEDCALAVIKSAQNLGLSTKSIEIIRDAFIEAKMLEVESYEVTGTVKSGSVPLENVTIEIYRSTTDTLYKTYTTDEEGKFNFELEGGTYKFVFKKEGFNEHTKELTINGTLSLNVELASEKKKEEGLQKVCTTDNCHNFTIYMYEAEGDCLVLKPEIFAVEDGAVLSMDMLIDTLNGTFGITTDGTGMNVSIGGINIPLEFYYYGTNTKYDWNTPVTEDVEIEFGGMDLDFYNALSGCNQ